MITVNDSKGMYTIKYDSISRICYEKNIGFWKNEDIERFHNDYVKQIGSYLGGKKWALCSDLREYKTSSITDEMSKHLEWKRNNNMACSAIIVENAIVKSQMNRLNAGQTEVQAFTDEIEAKQWLKSKGF